MVVQANHHAKANFLVVLLHAEVFHALFVSPKAVAMLQCAESPHWPDIVSPLIFEPWG